MAIDTSIYQGIKQPDMPSFLDSQAKAANLSSLMMQQAHMAKQMRLQDREQADDDAVRGAFKANIGPNGEVNRPGVLSELAKNSPLKAMEYKGKFDQMDVAQAEAQKKVLQDKLDRGALGYRLASGATDQASWDAAKKELQGMGLPVDHLKPEFDPAYVAGLKNHSVMMTLDAKQGLEAIEKMSQVGINEKKAPLDRGETIAKTRHLNAEADKLDRESPRLPPNITGQTDPAKLVPSLVPKEHQNKAFAEIDAAENTRRMSKAILDSFDQAVADTSGLGAITSYAKEPRSVQALHQAMQPTFKDLEGTVRQAAMDNTFKNISPMGTDTKKDTAIKRQALADYLQSKLSAPTARAYGIDLTQYDSTAPYKPAPKTAGSSGDWSDAGAQSAYAGEEAPTGPKMIRMKAPDGKIRLIPESSKGEAIAAGGQVVK